MNTLWSVMKAFQSIKINSESIRDPQKVYRKYLCKKTGFQKILHPKNLYFQVPLCGDLTL